MIADSVAFLRGQCARGRLRRRAPLRRIQAQSRLRAATLRAAADAGAAWIVLCDTNGGSLPEEIAEAVPEVAREIAVPLGIHTHNDGELAVANSLAAVRHGARQVQGTINGLGERCGNADLCSIIANLATQVSRLPGALARQAGSPHGGLPLRLRDGQHEFPPGSALRRGQRIRPQGGDARSRRAQDRRQLRAHRPRDRRQRAAECS